MVPLRAAIHTVPAWSLQEHTALTCRTQAEQTAQASLPLELSYTWPWWLSRIMFKLAISAGSDCINLPVTPARLQLSEVQQCILLRNHQMHLLKDEKFRVASPKSFSLPSLPKSNILYPTVLLESVLISESGNWKAKIARGHRKPIQLEWDCSAAKQSGYKCLFQS